jgi:hypothetical protein
MQSVQVNGDGLDTSAVVQLSKDCPSLASEQGSLVAFRNSLVFEVITRTNLELKIRRDSPMLKFGESNGGKVMQAVGNGVVETKLSLNDESSSKLTIG